MRSSQEVLSLGPGGAGALAATRKATEGRLLSPAEAAVPLVASWFPPPPSKSSKCLFTTNITPFLSG